MNMLMDTENAYCSISHHVLGENFHLIIVLKQLRKTVNKDRTL